MRTTLLAASILSVVATEIFAGDLAITGQTGLTWNPASGPSPTYLLGIENTTGTVDGLLAWQLSVRVTGTAGSTGSLRFSQAQLPVDYLLDGRSGGLLHPSFIPPSTDIPDASGWDSNLTGVTVPAGGKNLLAVDFVASPDAGGLFNIELMPLVGMDSGSYWIPNTTPILTADFANAPEVVGTVLIVPEPVSNTPVWLGVLLICLSAGRRN